MLNTFAHVKWFSEGSDASVLDSLNSTEWIVVAMLVAGGIALMLFVDKLFRPFDHKLDENLRRFREWIPTVVRYSTALLLIYSFLNDYFFAPNIADNDNFASTAVKALLILIAVMLIFGTYIRTAGLLLLISYLLAILAVDDSLQLLDHLEYLGIGSFLMLAGAGTWAVKGLIDPLEKLKAYKQYAIPLLKALAGLSLVVLAFSEKLLNLSLANDFLIEHNWNFMSAAGLSDRNFIIMIGVIEILLGLTLVLNRASRLGTLAILLTMIMTAALLGIEEVFGHLFAVGVVFATWIGPNEDLFKKRKYV